MIVSCAFRLNAVFCQTDTIPPHLHFIGDTNCIHLGSVWFDQAEFRDNVTPSNSLIVMKEWQSGPINTLIKRDYKVTYTVKDESNNVFVFKTTYRVRDCVPPTFRNMEDTICLRIGTPYDVTDPDYFDFIDPKDSLILKLISTNVNPNREGVYKEVFEVTDKSGNSRTGVRNIKVGFCGKLHAYIQLKNGFILKPNPADNQIQIILSEFNGSAKMNIYSYDSKHINTLDLNEQSNVIDISILASGIYFIEVNNNGRIDVQKLIVY